MICDRLSEQAHQDGAGSRDVQRSNCAADFYFLGRSGTPGTLGRHFGACQRDLVSTFDGRGRKPISFSPGAAGRQNKFKRHLP